MGGPGTAVAALAGTMDSSDDAEADDDDDDEAQAEAAVGDDTGIAVVGGTLTAIVPAELSKEAAGR